MSKNIGVFRYEATKMKKSDRQPFEPYVEICLKRSSDMRGDGPIISPQLMTEEAISYYIQLLKKDLDRVDRIAKAALIAAQTSTHEILASRISN